MKTLLLREIDVRVCRVEPRDSNQQPQDTSDASTTTSARYIFAVRPRPKARDHRRAYHYLQDRETRSWFELEDDSIDPPSPLDDDDDSLLAIPVTHEVARTYSQCRTLYLQLLALTDVHDPDACCCALGSCPFWSLSGSLKAVSFPRKTLFNFQSRRVFETRSRSLSSFMLDLLASLRGYYRPRHFREQPEPFRGAMACKVLATLGVFLELHESTVEEKLRLAERRLHGRLSLEGWLGHRSSLVGDKKAKASKKHRRRAQRLASDEERERKASESEPLASQTRGSLV